MIWARSDQTMGDHFFLSNAIPGLHDHTATAAKSSSNQWNTSMGQNSRQAADSIVQDTIDHPGLERYLHLGLGDYLATFLSFPNTISLSFVRRGRAGEA